MRRLLVPALCALAALALPASASATDRDHDRLPDGWELRHHLSLRLVQTHRDPDHDGLDNLAELRAGTNPRRGDTDRDGLPDGAELQTGNDPLRRASDGDGIRDGAKHAGLVASFDGRVLTIALPGGREARGTVSAATEVGCAAGGDPTAHVALGEDRAAVAHIALVPSTSEADTLAAGCTVANLAVGMPVHAAALGAGAAFTAVDLA